MLRVRLCAPPPVLPGWEKSSQDLGGVLSLACYYTHGVGASDHVAHWRRRIISLCVVHTTLSGNITALRGS